MLTVLDANNFWSPSGGGVRRYQLEKLRCFEGRDDVRYVFVQNDARRFTERRGENVVVEHVVAPSPPGGGDYRAMVLPGALRRLVAEHRPDVIECGSPYVMPLLVRLAGRHVSPRPALVGFWHADFPRAYAGRKIGDLNAALAEPAERAAWWWARRGYGAFDAIFVASRAVARNMQEHGLDRLYYTPLGVDAVRFSPERRDPELVTRFEAGVPGRPVIFFPHRFQDEKGLRPLLAAYDRLAERLDPVPALVFAGTGPDQPLVEAAVARHPHVHYVGYLDSPEAIARYYASASVSVALSAFETFGLSCAEAMASGLALVAADQGAAAELVMDSGAGLTVPFGDARALEDALETLLREGRWAERGARGRAHVQRFTWEACFERELVCYREVVEHVRRGERVPRGLHERLVT